jgi:predicted DNA-binding transcriptional regulator YafY
MPVTKSMLCRYQIINVCLSSKFKRYWSLQQLRAKLAENDINISNRTLEADIEAMRFDERLGYMAPISYCPLNKGYHYSDNTFSIGKLNLTDEDLETLMMAGNLMKSYENLSCLRKLPRIIEKIVAGTNIAALPEEDNIPEILIGSTLPENHVEKIDLLLKAIHDKTGVEIVLKNGESETLQSIVLHPYYIHEFEHAWYVAGFTEPSMNCVFLELELMESLSLRPNL